MSHVSEQERPRERKLDTPLLTLDDVDQRVGQAIAAEHQFIMDILTETVAHLQDEIKKEAAGKPGPRGEQGPSGKLPLVKLWMPETVYYEGDVVAYDGGTFQAKRDTGQSPSHADWICLATAGRDGNSITVRGTFDATAEYRRLDVVALNGGCFIARKDAPGPCPGPGWQLFASPRWSPTGPLSFWQLRLRCSVSVLEGVIDAVGVEPLCRFEQAPEVCPPGEKVS